MPAQLHRAECWIARVPMAPRGGHRRVTRTAADAVAALNHQRQDFELAPRWLPAQRHDGFGQRVLCRVADLLAGAQAITGIELQLRVPDPRRLPLGPAMVENRDGGTDGPTVEGKAHVLEQRQCDVVSVCRSRPSQVQALPVKPPDAARCIAPGQLRGKSQFVGVLRQLPAYRWLPWLCRGVRRDHRRDVRCGRIHAGSLQLLRPWCRASCG